MLDEETIENLIDEIVEELNFQKIDENIYYIIIEELQDIVYKYNYNNNDFIINEIKYLFSLYDKEVDIYYIDKILSFSGKDRENKKIESYVEKILKNSNEMLRESNIDNLYYNKNSIKSEINKLLDANLTENEYMIIFIALGYENFISLDIYEKYKKDIDNKDSFLLKYYRFAIDKFNIQEFFKTTSKTILKEDLIILIKYDINLMNIVFNYDKEYRSEFSDIFNEDNISYYINTNLNGLNTILINIEYIEIIKTTIFYNIDYITGLILNNINDKRNDTLFNNFTYLLNSLSFDINNIIKISSDFYKEYEKYVGGITERINNITNVVNNIELQIVEGEIGRFKGMFYSKEDKQKIIEANKSKILSMVKKELEQHGNIETIIETEKKELLSVFTEIEKITKKIGNLLDIIDIIKKKLDNYKNNENVQFILQHISTIENGFSQFIEGYNIQRETINTNLGNLNNKLDIFINTFFNSLNKLEFGNSLITIKN